MKLEEALELERRDFEKRLQLREKKGKDYATDADVLANFKVVAEVCAVFKKYGMPVDITTPHGVAVFYGILKLARRLNLYMKSTQPLNESLEDTFLDATNYLDLEKECYIDYARKIASLLSVTSGTADVNAKPNMP